MDSFRDIVSYFKMGLRLKNNKTGLRKKNSSLTCVQLTTLPVDRCNNNSHLIFGDD